MARKREKVSISTIASETGVSAAMVSRVINHRTGVSEENRRKILQKLREYDFHTHYPARHKHHIAVVYAAIRFSHYHSEVLSSVFSAMQEYDLEPCLMLYRPQSGASLLERLREQQCSGAVLVVPSVFSGELPELAESGLPVMLIDESTEVPGIGYVDNDSYTGSFAAARHLLELGHRRFLYFAVDTTALNHVQRLNGCRDALKHAGLEPHIIDEQCADTDELAYLRKQLAEHPEATAVMASNDDLAQKILKAAALNGLRVPEDLSVAGFDDYPMSRFLDPSLTTVRHPAREAGNLAVRALAEYLQSNGKTALPRLVLPTELTVRESTGPAEKN